MDITGARWSIDGAQAILQLRAITASGDLDDYWNHHITQERQRNHLSRYQHGLHSSSPPEPLTPKEPHPCRIPHRPA
jgi:hypothetical protein